MLFCITIVFFPFFVNIKTFPEVKADLQSSWFLNFCTFSSNYKTFFSFSSIFLQGLEFFSIFQSFFLQSFHTFCKFCQPFHAFKCQNHARAHTNQSRNICFWYFNLSSSASSSHHYLIAFFKKKFSTEADAEGEQ